MVGESEAYIESLTHRPEYSPTIITIMIKWLLIAVLAICLTEIYGDGDKVRVRIHVPHIKHDIHHHKTVYEPVKKYKHKVSHYDHYIPQGKFAYIGKWGDSEEDEEEGDDEQEEQEEQDDTEEYEDDDEWLEKLRYNKNY